MNIKKPDGVKGVIRMLEGLLEIGLLTLLYYIFWRVGYADGLFPDYYGKGKFVLCGVYALLQIVLFYNLDGFKFGYLKPVDILTSQLIAVVITNFISYWQLALIANVMIPWWPIVSLSMAQALVVVPCVFCFNAIYHRVYVPKSMVMVCGSDDAVSLKFKMENRGDKYKIDRIIFVDKGIDYICQEIQNYDAVIINDVHAETRNTILKFCYGHQIRTYIAPKLSDIIIRGASDISLFDTPLLLARSRGLTAPQRIMKRLMDLVLCAIAMIPAAPVMLLIALAIKIEDGGPVFYRQARATLDGDTFHILKFRSMIVDAENSGISVPATEKDPRITKVGRFIRSARLDELPQLLNILKGDMSIVGPRPERVEHVKKYTKKIPEFAFRLKVKGGLTGYAQIYGKYNTSPYDKLRLDMMYIENYSLLLDIKLILMTLRIILKKESTEGFDKSRELEKKKNAELKKLEEDEMQHI